MSDPAGQPRLLIVDDNPAIHEDFRKILGGQDKDADKLEQAEAAILGRSSAKNKRCHFAIGSPRGGLLCSSWDDMRVVKLAPEIEQKLRGLNSGPLAEAA